MNAGGDGWLSGVAGPGAVVRAEVGVRQADVAPAGAGDLVTAGTVSEPGRPEAADHGEHEVASSGRSRLRIPFSTSERDLGVAGLAPVSLAG
jgi:hypothetical protein